MPWTGVTGRALLFCSLLCLSVGNSASSCPHLGLRPRQGLLLWLPLPVPAALGLHSRISLAA